MIAGVRNEDDDCNNDSGAGIDYNKAVGAGCAVERYTGVACLLMFFAFPHAVNSYTPLGLLIRFSLLKMVSPSRRTTWRGRVEAGMYIYDRHCAEGPFVFVQYH